MIENVKVMNMIIDEILEDTAKIFVFDEMTIIGLMNV